MHPTPLPGPLPRLPSERGEKPGEGSSASTAAGVRQLAGAGRPPERTQEGAPAPQARPRPRPRPLPRSSQPAAAPRCSRPPRRRAPIFAHPVRRPHLLPAAAWVYLPRQAVHLQGPPGFHVLPSSEVPATSPVASFLAGAAVAEGEAAAAAAAGLDLHLSLGPAGS
uniref:Uncharacterized protein n=1 Tax=Ananas comosus var. bracteatus TaxID=296719 RepID=A0A6V7PW82_ANACO|nr:unnamed protein product [Ananas comosus var. bracteatus]